MNVDNLIRGTMLHGVKALAVDAFSTAFSKPQLNLSARIYSALASRGYPVQLDSGDVPLWRVYEKYLALDYRGKISGRARWCGILAELGIAFDEDLVSVLNLAEFDEHRQEARIFPGVLAFLVKASVRGLHLNLCTTASEVGWHFEELLGLPQYFDSIALSRQQGCDKKAADGETDEDTLFARLPEITGFPPHQILVVDDNKGYLACCKRLGMHTMLPLQGEAIGHYDPNAGYNRHIDIVGAIPDLARFLPQFTS